MELKEQLKEAFKAGQATESILNQDQLTDDEFNEWFESKSQKSSITFENGTVINLPPHEMPEGLGFRGYSDFLS